MDENDDQIILMIYDCLEYVRLNHYWKKILHYMLCNDKYKVEKYDELFDNINILVLYMLLNMNVVEKRNKQVKNEEVMQQQNLLDQIEMDKDLFLFGK